MKKCLIILICFIVPIFSISQNEIEIPKGVNKIKMLTSLNKNENVKLLLGILKENDFDISEDNKNLNLLYMLFSLIYFGQKIIYVSKENIIKNDLKEIINVMHKLNLIKYIK